MGMSRRFVLFASASIVVACGGKVAGDDGDASPVVPVEDTGVADYERCDDKISPAWSVGCDGSGVDHGQICSTVAGLERCNTLTNGCEGPSPDEILLSCDPGFFSRPGAKLGVDIDGSGCVTSIEWSRVDLSAVQCAVDKLTKVRFPCTGSTTIITPCTGTK
jgi:hypothetical protein